MQFTSLNSLGHPSDAAEIVVSKYISQGITLDSFLTYPQQDELTYELEYYLKVLIYLHLLIYFTR